MSGLIIGSALAGLGSKIIPGLKNGGGATSGKKGKKFKPPQIGKGMLHPSYSRLMKKGGRVRRRRRGRVKQ
jgi:hypothetical protein